MKALLSLLFLFIFNVDAQADNHSYKPAYCTPNSKYPSYWELEIQDPRFPPKPCPMTINSAVITDVIEVTGRSAKAKFSCTTQKEQIFDCSKIVDLYGMHIIGEEVTITTQYHSVSYPGCHIIGGCQRCVEISSYGQHKK